MEEVEIPAPEENAGPPDLDEAYVEEVDDGINMGTDDYAYTYWQIFTYSLLAYLSNPWALLIIAFLIYKIYGRIKQRYIDPLLDRFDEWNEQRREQAEAASIKKNPDEYRSKMEAMEVARAKLQEQYDRSTHEWMLRKSEQEEKKRQQEIEDWENHQQGKSYKSRMGTQAPDKEREALEQQARVKGKKGFKPDYNPLMGMGSGTSYRPPRRGNTGGG